MEARWQTELIPLALRAYHCLRSAGITTTAALCERSAAELLAIPQMGHTTVAEIREELASHGLLLRGDHGGYVELWRRLEAAVGALEAGGELAVRADSRRAVLSVLFRGVLGVDEGGPEVWSQAGG